MGTNRLVDAQSAYLQQHAHNPVDWWPWCDEAFEEARRRNDPIFLSIGYSACHWCHVMAHESFEDPEIANFLNERFVCIKVDREEHPDVDSLYMEAVQAMTGRGGWPMSVFLDPEGLPFYGGTYFPPHEGTSLPSFHRLIGELSRIFRQEHQEIDRRTQALKEAIKARTTLPAIEGTKQSLPTKAVITAFVEATLSNYDHEWGGLGRAPKFLQPHVWMSVIDVYQATGDKRLLDALSTTLDSVLAGGIYDHVGGGFARYSTDSFWMVPHFEKMLYDQAQNAQLFMRAALVTKNPNYQQAAIESIDFVIREMKRPDNLFAASFDADSNGEEGLFYTFRLEELQEIIDKDDIEAFVKTFGVTRSGNFEGRNILHRPERGSIAKSPKILQALSRVYDFRLKRYKLSLDSKAIVEWNAMFITTLAEAGFHFDRDDYLVAAKEAFQTLYKKANFDTVATRLALEDNYQNGARAIFADYAQMLAASLALCQFSASDEILKTARSLLETMKQEFYNPETRGFFTTARSASKLIANTTDIFDSAYPSANSVAARAIILMGNMTADSELVKFGVGIVEGLSQLVQKNPQAFPVIVSEITKLNLGTIELVIPENSANLVAEARSRYLANLVFSHGGSSTDPLWKSRKPGLAYLCREFTCEAPTDSPMQLAAQLDIEVARRLD